MFGLGLRGEGLAFARLVFDGESLSFVDSDTRSEFGGWDEVASEYVLESFQSLSKDIGYYRFNKQKLENKESLTKMKSI